MIKYSSHICGKSSLALILLCLFTLVSVVHAEEDSGKGDKHNKLLGLNFVMETDHFEFYADPFDYSIVDTVALILEDNCLRVLNDLMEYTEKKIKVSIYPDLKSFHYGIGHPDAPDWVIGSAVQGKEIAIVSPQNPGPTATFKTVLGVLVHEYTHCVVGFINNYTTSWMNEGTATFITGMNNNRRISDAQMRKIYEEYGNSIPSISVFEGWNDFVENYGYDLSSTIVQFLLLRHDFIGLRQMIESPYDPIKLGYKSFADFESQWKSYIMDYYLSNDRLSNSLLYFDNPRDTTIILENYADSLLNISVSGSESWFDIDLSNSCEIGVTVPGKFGDSSALVRFDFFDEDSVLQFSRELRIFKRNYYKLKGAEYSFMPEKIILGFADSSKAELNITSTIDWHLENIPPWLNAEPAFSDKSESVNVTAAGNFTLYPRRDTLCLVSKLRKLYISLTQDPMPVQKLELSRQSVSLDNEAASVAAINYNNLHSTVEIKKYPRANNPADTAEWYELRHKKQSDSSGLFEFTALHSNDSFADRVDSCIIRARNIYNIAYSSSYTLHIVQKGAEKPDAAKDSDIYCEYNRLDKSLNLYNLKMQTIKNISIFNLLGSRAMQIEANSTEPIMTYFLESLAQGAYFVVITTESGTEHYQFCN